MHLSLFYTIHLVLMTFGFCCFRYRYKRQQLVQLQQLDGKVFWCGLKELVGNCSCMLVMHNPAGAPVVKTCKRLDACSIPQQQLLLVESPEPFKLLACLSMGPQHIPLPPQPATPRVSSCTVICAGVIRV